MKNKILQKFTKNGLKYKNYLYYINFFFFFFHFSKKYDCNSKLNYLKKLKFSRFFPFFTRKKQKIVFLVKNRRRREFLKWFDFFLKIQLFRQFTLRLMFIFNELLSFYFYNIFTYVKKKIILKVFKKKKTIFKKKSGYLGKLNC